MYSFTQFDNNESKFKIVLPIYLNLYKLANPINDLPTVEYKKGWVYIGSSKLRLKEFLGCIDNLQNRILEDAEDKVKAYMDMIEWAPFYIANGDCTAKNLKLVEIKNNIVIYEGKKYYYPPFRIIHNDQSKSEWKTVRDGVAYCYIVDKKLDWANQVAFRETSTGRAARKLLELAGETMHFPCFALRDYVTFDETYIPFVTDLYLYPYGNNNGVSMTYTASVRSGLDVDVTLSNVTTFVERACLKKSWGYNQPLTFMTKELKDTLYKIANQINDVLQFSQAKYDIDDEDSYGEYSLRNIKLKPEYVGKINKILLDHFKAFQGKKYLTTLSEINANILQPL